MNAVRLPEGARFSCQSCGQCCQGWAVPVEQETVDKLRAHDWGAEPFERIAADEGHQIKLVNGRCFFLDRENRCRIHTELSYEAKPVVCRAFPLGVLEVEGKRYARLSYWCPTVVANTGKPLEHQARWVNETAKHDDRRIAPLALNEGHTLSGRAFERVHQALRRLLRNTTIPIEERLAAASALIRSLDEAAQGNEASAGLEEVVARAESAGAATLAAETRQIGNASAGRRILSLYHLQDRQPGRLALLARLAAVLTYNAGLTKLRSRAVGASASWRQIRSAVFAPSAESSELLTRYFCSKLDSRRYIAGEMTLVSGVNLLLVAYGMINVMARTRAVSQGRQTSNEEDVRHAVRAADLLVVEHSDLYRGRFHAKLTQTALGERNLGAEILACL